MQTMTGRTFVDADGAIWGATLANLSMQFDEEPVLTGVTFASMQTGDIRPGYLELRGRSLESIPDAELTAALNRARLLPLPIAR